MVSVGKLEYEISADTRKFQQGMTATQKELRAAKKVFRETEEPAAKYGRKVEELATLHKKGLISSKQYRRALDAERTAMKKASKDADAFGLSLKSLGPAVVGVAAIAGLTRGINSFGDAVKEQFVSLDQLGKKADQLGIAVSELQSLRFAAGQTAGMDAKEFDTSLQRIVRRTAQAAQGMGEAQEAFRTLGLDAKQLVALRPEQAFYRIADAMQMIPGDAERLRLTVALADTEGAKLVNTFAAGSEEIVGMRDELEKMNVLLDRDSVRAIEAANDAMAELKTTIDGATQSAAVGLAPVIKSITDDLQNLAFGGTTDGAKRFGRGLDAVYKGLGPFLTAPESQGMFPGTTGLAGGLIGQAIQDGLSGIGEASSGVQGLTQSEKAEQVRLIQEQHAADVRASTERRHREYDDRIKASIANENLRLEALQGLFAGVKEAAKQAMPDAASFGSGSREEYEFLRQRQKQDQEAAERKRANDAAQAKRDELIQQMREVGNRIFDLQQKLEPTVGV